MTDPAIITAVIIITSAAIANALYAHSLHRRIERALTTALERVTRIEDAAHRFSLVDVQEPKYSAVTLESADWCAKRKRFVVNVRVVDRTGTRRVNGLVESIDDATLRRELGV